MTIFKSKSRVSGPQLHGHSLKFLNGDRNVLDRTRNVNWHRSSGSLPV